MNIFMIYIRDENFYQLLPEKFTKQMPDNGRVKVMAMPPLGIQTLASIVRQAGHRVRMFDTCHPEMKSKHIEQALKDENPDAIALSFLSTTTYPAAKSMAERLKKSSPGTPIIVGGVFASMNAVHILKDCDYMDCVGVGEGDELIPDYLNNMDAPDQVAGLVWRNGSEIISNQQRPLVKDLNKFPYPDRTSLPIDYIESLPLDVPAVLSLDRFCTIQTSRGCPYNCVYCDIPAFSHRKWRYRSAEHVLGEMQELNDAGFHSIYLTDDHFLLNRKRISAICHGIIERKFEFHWGCEGRVDSVALDQLPIMSEAGCTLLMYGIESGTQKTLDRLNKRQNLKQIENAIYEAKRHGISRTHGSLIIGSPGETEEEILESFRFVARMKLDTFNFSRLCVYRGTPLWKEYIDRGIIDDERDWYKYFKCSDIDSTVLPSESVNRARMKGYGLLFARRIFGRPIQSLKLLRILGRNMEIKDILKLLSSPFIKRPLMRKPDLPARMMDLGLEAPVRDRSIMQ